MGHFRPHRVCSYRSAIASILTHSRNIHCFNSSKFVNKQYTGWAHDAIAPFGKDYFPLSKRLFSFNIPSRRPLDVIFPYKKNLNIISVRRSVQTVAEETPAPILGHATTEGTARFIQSSQLTLHHHMRRTNLYINPIIHGPPKYASEVSKEDLDRYLAKALLGNRSNCLFIYNHNASSSWHTEVLHHILSRYDDFQVKRDQVVTVAGLGFINDRKEIEPRLDAAIAKTLIGNIDMAIVMFSEDTLMKNVTEVFDCLKLLNSMCENGKLKGFGVALNIPPFCYHTPPARRSTMTMTLPAVIERFIDEECPYGELLIYKISPSIAVPATYPVLPAHPEEYLDEEAIEYEQMRSYSRASIDPFTCLPGTTGPVFESEDEELVHRVREGDAGSIKPMKGDDAEVERAEEEVILVDGIMPQEVQAVLGSVLDDLCPALSSTPRLEDKALRVVFSVGIDCVIVDASISAYLEPISLSSNDLLTSDDTEDVFGEFMVPGKVQDN